MNSNHSLERIKEEFNDLTKHPVSDLGITVGLKDGNLYTWITTYLGPQDTPYKGGLFYLHLIFSKNYPEKAPEIQFILPIYHPNVNIRGSDNEPLGNFNYSDINSWNPSYNIKQLLVDIYSIFYWPNLEKPHSLEIANEYINNRELFEKKALYFAQKNIFLSKRRLETWDFSCDENYLKSVKKYPKKQKKNLNYDYNGDELIDLFIYINGFSKSEQKIQCKSKEKARFVFERLKVKYSIEINLNKDTLFISNSHNLNLDATIGENDLRTNSRIIIIPKGKFA